VLEFKESFTGILRLFTYFEYLIILLVVVGFIVINFRKKYAFVLYSMFLLLLTVIYYHFNINILIFYERNLMFLFQSFAIPFGVSISYISSRFKESKTPLVILFIILLLIVLIPSKIESTKPVYQIINDKEYKEFLKYKEIDGNRAVLDPWKAIAFGPIAEKEIYSRVPPGPNLVYSARNKEIKIFFNQSCSNKTFLKDNKINIVIGCSSLS